ncbi:MAG TPA: hypothetical protein VIO94_15680 [Phenylobacterium sp.]
MTPSLRRVLYVDGLGSLASAALLIAAAQPLSEQLSLPQPLLFETGLALVPFALGVLYVASRREIPRPGVVAIIALNIVWCAASLILLASGATAPNLAGYVVVAVQALGVGLLAELEYLGLRRLSAASA